MNQIVAFGDSLTDTGNASIATHGVEPGAGYAYRTIPGLPFQVGEFTTGTSGLWVDQFAAKAGLPDPQPFLAPGGGTNYAVGGAKTSSGPGSIDEQVGFFLGGRTAVASTSLYAVWAGADNILNGGNGPVAAADDLEHNIATLAGDGGKYFLWFNLPLLGNTPKFAGTGSAAGLNTASLAFNTEWSADIASLEKTFPGIVLVGVDVASLFSSLGNNPDLFTFDKLHPTSAADGLIANLAFNDFEAALGNGTTGGGTVPEPATAALALIGVCAVAASKLKAKYRS